MLPVIVKLLNKKTRESLLSGDTDSNINLEEFLLLVVFFFPFYLLNTISYTCLQPLCDLCCHRNDEGVIHSTSYANAWYALLYRSSDWFKGPLLTVY